MEQSEGTRERVIEKAEKSWAPDHSGPVDGCRDFRFYTERRGNAGGGEGVLKRRGHDLTPCNRPSQ